MSYNEKFIFTSTKLGKWILTSFVLFLLSGCSANKEELNEEAFHIPSSEQESKADNVAEKEKAIPYDDFEYFDFYSHHYTEFLDTSKEAIEDIRELNSNQSLVKDFSFMTSHRVKTKRLTEINNIFTNFTDENRVPDASLKLHKLTLELFGSTILTVNKGFDVVKPQGTTMYHDYVKSSENMNTYLEETLFEYEKFTAYILNEIRTEEKNTAAANQEKEKNTAAANQEKEKTANKNSDTNKNTIKTKPEDYNSLGEYQPVESMTQDEIQKELEMILKDALGK